MRQRRTLHINKRGKISKGNNNYQPIFTKCQCTQCHQIYTKGLKSTYRHQHSGRGRLSYPSTTNKISHLNKKINKEILALNDTKDHMDITDVYRIFHLATAQYTFFSAAHKIFSKIDDVLGHKAIFSKYKKNRNNPLHSI
jgi:hypothetical protein